MAVFPLKRTGTPNERKRPDPKWAPHGFKDATTDPATIRRWWATQAYNIGVAAGASKLSVVDVDTRHGGTVPEGLPPTLMAKTGGGGWHLFYRCEGARSGKPAKGIDLKAGGGYVVVAPSDLGEGRVYSWANDLPIAYIAEVELAVVLAAMPQDTHAGVSRAGWVPFEFAANGSVHIGRQHDYMVRAAAKLVAMGYEGRRLEEAIEVEAAAVCSPPIEQRDLANIIDWADGLEPS